MTYEQLQATNVGGTCELMRLALADHIKPVHYISTTSVFDTAEHKKLNVCLENDSLASCTGLSGYPLSKWVAERLLMSGRRHGLPVSIYRPGFISGAATTGVWNCDDFLCRLLKGCVQLGVSPIVTQAGEWQAAGIDMTPVDVVAASVVALCVKPASLGHAFHVTNPRPVPYAAFFASLSSAGFDVRPVPYAEWRRRLDADASTNTAQALLPLLGHFSPSWPETLHNPIYDQQNAQAVHHCPDVAATLPTCLNYLIAGGFMPQPMARDASSSIDTASVTVLVSRSNRAAAA